VRAATLGRVEDIATTIGDKMNQTRDTLLETVRQNPIPAALTGAGLVWLLMSRSKSASNAMSRARSAAGNTAAHWTEATSRRAHDASDAVGHVLDGASESASQLVHRAADTAQHWVSGAEDAASNVALETRRELDRAQRGLQSTYRANPLPLAAAALAIGAVAGLALPRTEREDELLGEARDNVLRKAGDAAHDAAASVSHLAERALDGVKQAAPSVGDGHA
jgi:hypothetical protein